MIDSLIHGVGYWKGLSLEARQEQIRYLISSCRDFYPSLRVYLCDNKRVYSSPIAVFGHFLAVVYIGRYYMVFREVRQIQALTQHFDNLVREAEVDARSVASVIEKMADEAWR